MLGVLLDAKAKLSRVRQSVIGAHGADVRHESHTLIVMLMSTQFMHNCYIAVTADIVYSIAIGRSDITCMLTS